MYPLIINLVRGFFFSESLLYVGDFIMNGKKFVVYKRLSKQKAGGNQHGFDSQQFDLDYYFQSQESPDIIGEFQEFYSGGGSWTKRQELVKAVELCKSTGATLVVTKVDRLGRNTASVATLLEMIPVVITSMPHAENMVIQILAAVAEKEREMISARTKAALQVVKAKGTLVGAASPKYKRIEFSKSRGGKKSEDFALSLKDSLVSYRSMNTPYSVIAEKWNSQGKTTRQGKPFLPMTVSRLCKQLGVK